MVERRIFPYRVTCPFCHSFDTFRACKELGQLNASPHYIFPTGRYAAVCIKCGAKFSNMKLELKQNKSTEKCRPIASILNYEVLELPDFMQEIKDVNISTFY